MVTKTNTDLALIAHLMRRAGFGATLSEIGTLSKKPYEVIVDDLLDTSETEWMGEHMVRRFDTEASGMINPPGSQRRWIYRLISSDSPLEEKMTLFWHTIFPAGRDKVINGRVLSDQIDTFRKFSLDKFLRKLHSPSVVKCKICSLLLYFKERLTASFVAFRATDSSLMKECNLTSEKSFNNSLFF